MLNTRANLFHKNILDTTACPRCNLPVEDRDHLFFTCMEASAVWSRLDITPSFATFTDIWTTIPPHGLLADVWPSIALIILWKIWDSRNAKVFRAMTHTSAVTVSNIVLDLTLWANRCRKPVQKEHTELWCQFLSSRRA